MADLKNYSAREPERITGSQSHQETARLEVGATDDVGPG
jgi:hypothetical protein